MKATKHDCVGCRDDYYNHGNNSTTGECWLLKKAKMVTRYAIGWWTPQDKASNFYKTRKPNCYSQPGSTAYYDELPQHLRRA